MLSWITAAVSEENGALPGGNRQGAGAAIPRGKGGAGSDYMPCWFGSSAMSAEIRTTGSFEVFFHQCDRPPCSTERSPVLWTIGSAQWLEYSVMVPETTIDERRTLGVAVPGDFTAGLDVEAAHAEVVTGDGDLFLRQVDLAEELFGDVLVRGGAGLLAVGGDFARPGIRRRWRPSRRTAARRPALRRSTGRADSWCSISWKFSVCLVLRLRGAAQEPRSREENALDHW